MLHERTGTCHFKRGEKPFWRTLLLTSAAIPTDMSSAQSSSSMRIRRRLSAKSWRINSREKIDVVVGPALGGVIMAYEMGRQLGIATSLPSGKTGI